MSISDTALFVGLVLFGLFALFVAALLVTAPFQIRYVTSSGEHTGYVTAVEENGVFFKTWTVYVKTSPESTQEDMYCIDKYDEGFVQLKDALKAASADGERVTLSFHSYFSSGFKHCWTETAIVDGIVR